MLRVFDIHHDNTEFHPIAFSGDIGNGPTTAYDALPPKPWKAPTVVEEAPPKHRHETNQFVKDSMRVFVHEVRSSKKKKAFFPKVSFGIQQEVLLLT